MEYCYGNFYKILLITVVNRTLTITCRLLEDKIEAKRGEIGVKSEEGRTIVDVSLRRHGSFQRVKGQ